jgi:hypothetical protein
VAKKEEEKQQNIYLFDTMTSDSSTSDDKKSPPSSNDEVVTGEQISIKKESMIPSTGNDTSGEATKGGSGGEGQESITGNDAADEENDKDITAPTTAVAVSAHTPTKAYDDISYYHTIYHTDYPTAPTSSSTSANGNDQETEITESDNKQNQKKEHAQEKERTDPKDTATSSDDGTAKGTNSDEQNQYRNYHQRVENNNNNNNNNDNNDNDNNINMMERMRQREIAANSAADLVRETAAIATAKVSASIKARVTANVAATAARVTAKMQQLTNKNKRHRETNTNTNNEKKDDNDNIFTNDVRIKKIAKVAVSNKKKHHNGGTNDYNNNNNNNNLNNNINSNNHYGGTATTYACRDISRKKMGKKRKDHPTMPGQFDDAPELITGSGSSSSSSNNNNNNNDPNIGHLCSEALVTPYFRNQLGEMFDPNANPINPETRRVLLQQLQQQRIEKLRSEQRRGQRAPHLSPLQRQAVALNAQLEAAVSGLADPYQQQQQQRQQQNATPAVGYKPVALTAAASEATVNSPHGLALQIRLKTQILKAHMEYNAALLAIDRRNQMPLLPQQQQQNQQQQAGNQPTNNMQQP